MEVWWCSDRNIATPLPPAPTLTIRLSKKASPPPPIYDCNGRDYAFPTIAACPNYKGARLFAAEEWLPNADIVAALVPGWLLCAAAGFAHAVLGVRCIAT